MAQKTTNLSKEQIMEAAKKKKLCTSKAQRIVESLLETGVNRDVFLENMKSINQCHYVDVVDERHIMRLCGYPLCDKSLENIPTKKYQISVTTNKVYDITERKKYCSTHCFKASEYIKSQLLTSPLWLRQQENVPDFMLLDPA